MITTTVFESTCPRWDKCHDVPFPRRPAGEIEDHAHCEGCSIALEMYDEDEFGKFRVRGGRVDDAEIGTVYCDRCFDRLYPAGCP